MKNTFKPKVALITGGGSGIGAAMARELASRGTFVVVADINFANASAISSEIGERAEAAEIDVSDQNAVKSLIAGIKNRLGSLDCLVNCAGITSYGEALHSSLDEWEKILSVNLMGTIIPSMAAYEIMAKQRSGTIINMGSMATFLVDPLFAPYITSKFGVVGFSRTLATEAKAYGVHVCVVCPGNIQSALAAQRYAPSRFTPIMQPLDAVQKILKAVSQKRRIIVFPTHARIFWWLDRLDPNFLNPLRQEIFRRAQRRNAFHNQLESQSET